MGLSSPSMIDFRSDTVTQPGTAMLESMMRAPIGDDVFGEDPSINALESLSASIFGMEAAVFCPSGTMTNQIAIKCHTRPGDEVICDHMSHIYLYEGGGIAANSGASVRLLAGDRGRITADMVAAAINPVDIHKPATTLVSLENTANRGGGSCYKFADIQSIKEVCLQNNLKLHLDGARIFNAIVAKNESAKWYGETFDTISVCLSKGLGAPVGSVLLGNHDFIQKARRVRKLFGGGMRQAGYLAAAGIYALENNVQRLEEDHRHTKMLETAIAKKDFVGDILPVETNILIFEVKGRYTSPQLTAKLKDHGILAIAISPTQVRLVVHLNISPQEIQTTISLIETL
ncbi:MAG TPA: low-specificity L-threonine aldolase [Sediminibacterium sp.]|nr:low-specificity L-threonine aldolase [Sediminibacterium sp.]HQS54715.1 low-specificity L-threonine aldolase [Sediminibacterium sp.]